MCKFIQHSKLLDDHFEFNLTKTTNFYESFLATLRLCNRSIQRMIKDRNDFDKKYSYFGTEVLSRVWKFPASKHAVFDLHKINKNNLRTDQTQSIGNYKSILGMIEQAKDSFNYNKSSYQHYL